MTRKRYADWKGTDETLVFPVLSDVHSWFDTVDPDDWSDPKTHIRLALEAVRAFDADCLADLGDIGLDCYRDWRSASTPERARRHLAAYAGLTEDAPVPVLFCPGNHDHGKTEWKEERVDNGELGAAFNCRSARKDASLVLSPKGDYGYYDVPGKDVRLVFLNTSEVGDIGMSPEQLGFVDGALASLPSGSAVFFLSHVPFHPETTRKVTGDYQDERTWARDLRLRLERFVSRGGKIAGVLSGHKHSDHFVDGNGVRHVVVQGLGHCGEKPPFAPGITVNDIDDFSLETDIDVVAIKPRKREGRIFRIGAGGCGYDRGWTY